MPAIEVEDDVEDITESETRMLFVTSFTPEIFSASSSIMRFIGRCVTVPVSVTTPSLTWTSTSEASI